MDGVSFACTPISSKLSEEVYAAGYLEAILTKEYIYYIIVNSLFKA
jgi:hypothetical protein